MLFLTSLLQFCVYIIIYVLYIIEIADIHICHEWHSTISSISLPQSTVELVNYILQITFCRS